MNNIDYALIGNKIRQKRKEMGYSQEDLAEMCEISVSYVGHIERGTKKMSIPIAVNIAHALHLSLDYLFLDAADSEENILLSVNSLLKQGSKEQVSSLLKAIKVLSENIDKL
jgi:transcriptional regulator with XRE-family HTH domain